VLNCLSEKHKIWLDGVSNADIGLTLQEPFRLYAPVPNVTTVTIPGRNGDLHYYDGSYQNRRGEVSAYLLQEEEVVKSFVPLHNWMFGKNGYRRLEIDHDPDHFLMARVKNGADIIPRINKLSSFILSFDCKPQRYLKIGEEAIAFEKNEGVEIEKVIENPTLYPAKPLYKITGTGSGYFAIGENAAILNSMDGVLYYDAETETAYRGSENLNHKISVSQDLICGIGSQTVTIGGSITRLEIIPRWWEL
jgi:phage-related protein